MKVISLLNEKGGVGKTTLSVHAAAGLAIKGYRVLLIDADAQGHATIALGRRKEPGFYDLIVRDAPFDEVLRRIPPQRYATEQQANNMGKGDLYLVPSNVETRSISQNISDAFAVLKRVMQLREAIDVVIFDTSPTPSLTHASIYMATDAIVMPTKLEAWSFDGLRESMAHKDQFQPIREQYQLGSIKLFGIVPTLYRRGTLEQETNLEVLRKRFGERVWSPIPMRTIWSEAATAKRTVFALAPGSKTEADAWRYVNKMEEALNVP
ncbi:MAG: ParA family protein [Chloroflexota bacterium]